MLSINSDHLPVGDAVIIGSGENSASPLTVHAITGIAVHTRHARVFLQGAFAPGETRGRVRTADGVLVQNAERDREAVVAVGTGETPRSAAWVPIVASNFRLTCP